jgi:hypothetical protein
MNAGFIGIGSMGGTLVRALATESHGDLGGRHHVCASSTVPTRSTGSFARSSPRPAWRWGVNSTSQVLNLKKATSTSSCSPGFAVNFGNFAGVEMSPRPWPPCFRSDWQLCPWRVHARPRETLEVVLADRLHFGRGGPNATELRADAKAGGDLAEKRIDGRHCEGGHLRGVCREQAGGSKTSCPHRA